MRFSNLLKTTPTIDTTTSVNQQSTTDTGVTEGDVLADITDTPLNLDQRAHLVASARAKGVSEEDIAYFYPLPLQ